MRETEKEKEKKTERKRKRQRQRKRIASSPLQLETDPTLTTDCALSTKQEIRVNQKNQISSK